MEHPLRARAALQRADESDLLALVGPVVTEALQEVLVQDETWLAVFGEDLPGHVARMGVSEGKPSRKRVEEAAAAMGAVVDAAFRETGRAMRISVLSRALAAGFGMSEGVAHAIGIAGHLLDIGQLGVPTRVME